MADQTDQGIQPAPTRSAASASTASHAPGRAPDATISESASGPLTADTRPAILDRLDLVLVVALMVLAFLVGSFAATNSDVWLHLASGRAIAQGQWTIGVDPFSFATEGTPDRPAIPWVQHSWLYSWLFYLLYGLVGGGGLVIIKALMVVAMAWCLVQIPGGKRDRFLAVIYVGMAILAISPQVILRPMTVSFLLFAVTLLICYRAGALGNVPANPRVLWGLPLLFLLWANLDVWFIMGPVILALLLVGNGLAALLGIPRSFPTTTLAAALGVGLLACLVNPHHIHVFMLPPELANLVVRVVDLPDSLGAGGRTLRNLQIADQDYYPLPSPLSPRYWGNAAPGGGRNIGALAYYPLLILGVISFVVNAVVTKKPGAPGLHPGRFAVWVTMAFLSLLQARLIPWFALASAPLTMLNLVDWRTWLTNIQVPNWRPALLGRALTLFLFLMLVLLAWPGWLYAPPGDFTSGRRVAWKVSVDPSYHAAALRLSDLNQGGRGLRVLNFSPDIAHYCAWYAPGVKCFFDARWSLFPDDAAVAVKTRRGLAVGEPEAWHKTFVDRQVDRLALVAGNFQRRREADVVERLWQDEAHWLQEYADGWTFVFAWSGPDKLIPETSRAEVARKAFGQVADDQRAPARGPMASEETSLWSQYWDSPPTLPLAYYEASLWLHYHRVMALSWAKAFFSAPPGSEPAGSIAYQVAHGAEPAGLGHQTITLPYLLCTLKTIPNKIYGRRYVNTGSLFLKARDAGSPAAPLLMVRAARRAAAEDPQDPRVYQMLAEAYSTVLGQEEHWANYTGDARKLGRRFSMRQMQRMTALQSYLALRPEDPAINEVVGEIFKQRNFFDIALEHLQKAAEHIDRYRPSAGATQELEAFKVEKAKLDKRVKDLEAEVKKRREDYEKAVAFGSKKGLEKYPLAMARGLPKEAADVLTSVKVEALSPEEKRAHQFWLIDLWLMMGRAGFLSEDVMSQGLAEFRLFHAAALGNYVVLDKVLGEMEKNLADTRARVLPEATMVHGVALCMPGQGMMDPASLAVQVFAFHARQQAMSRMLIQPESELRTLRGIVSLEYGDTTAARKHFAAALELAGPDLYFQDRAIAERYGQLLRDANK